MRNKFYKVRNTNVTKFVGSAPDFLAKTFSPVDRVKYPSDSSVPDIVALLHVAFV